MDERVEEMKMDLATRFHDAVVVARGPIASWTALLYLESLPLKGLVCVDPIPFDATTPTTTEHRGATTTDSRTARSMLLDTYSTTSDPIVFQIFDEILSDDARTLQLEPNAVPMLILHSVLAAAGGGGGKGDTNKKEEEEEDNNNNRQRRRQCEMVAERHGDPNGPFGEVEIRECSPDDPEFALQMIDEWIETIL